MQVAVGGAKCFSAPVDSTFFPVPVGSLTLSGLISLMTQMAAITSLMPSGGFFMVFTTAMSAGWGGDRGRGQGEEGGREQRQGTSRRGEGEWTGGGDRGREQGRGQGEGMKTERVDL